MAHVVENHCFSRKPHTIWCNMKEWLNVVFWNISNLPPVFVFWKVAKQQEQSASTQKAEREVTKMVIMMIAGFLVCWLPYASFALWAVTHRGETFDLRMASIPSVFSKASTVYNPFIYIFMNRQVSLSDISSLCLAFIFHKKKKKLYWKQGRNFLHADHEGSFTLLCCGHLLWMAARCTFTGDL